MRSPCALMLVTAAVVLTGCANPGPTDDQSGGPAGNAAGPATSQPASAASPQEVMTRLIGYIADDDGPAACGLMVKAAQAAVTQDLGVAPDCPSTISVISSSVSDKDAFRSMKPTGMVVRGDKAKVSGYCLKGWSRADGNPDDGSTDTPNRLGDFGLRKFDDGWKIYGFSSAKHYSSCGG